jgi:hypothetical protein
MMWWREKDAAPTELGEINRDGCYKDVAPDGAAGRLCQSPIGFIVSNAELAEQNRLKLTVS